MREGKILSIGKHDFAEVGDGVVLHADGNESMKDLIGSLRSYGEAV